MEKVKIIQGGMGINISNWYLAKKVSMLGQLGTLSGAMLERILVHTLQRGDKRGDIRKALSHFSFPEISKEIIKEFYVEGGINKGEEFKKIPIFTINPSRKLISLTICANYVFVWLAKEGHNNPISINYLEKIAMPHIYAIYGAMLANVDFITIGAGIPLQIPGVIDAISKNENVSYRIPVTGQNLKSWTMNFSPKNFFGENLPVMKKPGFIPIISSNFLAETLHHKLPKGSIYGFAIERTSDYGDPNSGGHNASPRNKISYGEKDLINYEKIKDLGIPFWIGGATSSPEMLKWAIGVGANGIQAGSIFALCEESGMNFNIRKKICELGFSGKLKIRTDLRVSPTGFPFKVALLENTLSEKNIYESRNRICNIGGLVSLYEKANGNIGYRCTAEPVDMFIKKGGTFEETIGRGCLCNGLFTSCDSGNYGEAPIITLGDNYDFLSYLMTNYNSSYGAKDAIKYLLG